MPKENNAPDKALEKEPEETLNTSSTASTDSKEADQQLSETWAHDTIQELDDWIESQGIYLRQ